MSLSKKEIYRLVDALPDRDTQMVKRFIELVLMRSRAQDGVGEQPFFTLDEAAPILQLTPRRLRYLIHGGVIPAYKDGGRWLIRAEHLQELLTPEAREFLSHPFAKDDLTEEEKADSEEGWRQYLAGETKTLDEVVRAPENEPKD